jgi:protoheme IX farnesyltransferase
MPGRGASQRFTLLAVFATVATFVLLLFGSNVTARSAGAIFLDWPLMNGGLFPFAKDTPADLAALFAAQALHRYVAGVVLLILVGVAVAARRLSPRVGRLESMANGILVLYLVQVVVGGLQVLTLLSGWSQTLHVALGTLIWGGSVALAATAYYGARLEPGPAGRGTEAGLPTTSDPGQIESPAEPGTAPSSKRATIKAYVALTKPRIIELLLVTTLPAMVLATREVPGIQPLDWLRLTFWTLVCGTLAAGAANAINQYLDRDIDARMTRTRRRPLPAHDVTPERAMGFGIVLGIISIALMAMFVNLLAAFLTLLAIAFYVFVYTIMLKRSTPQNIVIGGAAGALPPVIGWAAVTGNVGLPAIMLFLLVFYWTPPHFWALAMRLRGDYAALHGPARCDLAGVCRRRPDGRGLFRGRGAPRSHVPVEGFRPLASGLGSRRVDRAGHSPVPLLDQLPDAPVRGRRHRRGRCPAIRLIAEPGATAGRLSSMRRGTGMTRVLLSLGLAASSLVTAPSALADTTFIADCAPPLPIEKAVFSDLVFVGQVTQVTNEGRAATVQVTEVWRGSVPTPVIVNGGSDPTNPAEDDRSFEVGVTYLFIPTQLDGLRQGFVTDSVCSSTTQWTDDLARLRPAEVGQPQPSAGSTSGPNPLAFLDGLAAPILTAGLVAGSAFVLAWFVARRREA